MRCPYCNAKNPQGVVFCGDCGERIVEATPGRPSPAKMDIEITDDEATIVRPYCDSVNPLGMTFCGNCGERIQEGTPQKLSSSPSVSLETKVLRLIVDPAMTIAALAPAIGQIWSRALVENPQSPYTFAQDMKTAADLSAGGLVAFAILVVIAICLPAYSKK